MTRGVVIESDGLDRLVIRTTGGDVIDAVGRGCVGDQVRYDENDNEWRPLRAAVWVRAR